MNNRAIAFASPSSTQVFREARTMAEEESAKEGEMQRRCGWGLGVGECRTFSSEVQPNRKWKKHWFDLRHFLLTTGARIAKFNSDAAHFPGCWSNCQGRCLWATPERVPSMLCRKSR